MSRILEPGQIEALASRTVPRVRLPEREHLFARRAARLLTLAERDPLGGYLRLAAAIAAAQQDAVGALTVPAPDPGAVETARAHGMPLVPARGFTRDAVWRAMLARITAAVGATRGFPPAVAGTCARLAAEPAEELEARADRLLAADGRDADPAAAPFVIAALQAYWVRLASALPPALAAPAAATGVCPVCGMPPVASIVHSTAPCAGFRYLQCGLCATEWHRVRVECTQCGATTGVALHSIDGGPPAIRAETCDSCHAYRKIFYEEHDADVEPLADDLASVALDLLLAEAGFHRASVNPLLWQPEP